MAGKARQCLSLVWEIQFACDAVAPDSVRVRDGEFAENALRPPSANPIQRIGAIFVAPPQVTNIGYCRRTTPVVVRRY